MLVENTSQWVGTSVYLRAVEPQDWETHFHWTRDDEQSRSLYFVPFPQSQESVRRLLEREAAQGPQEDNFRFAIARITDGTLVGDITTHRCDARAGTLSYDVNISQTERRKGYATEAITLVLRYYFEERRYQKVTVHIYSFNEASIRLHERLGFQREGCVRRMVYTQGRHYDELLFGLTMEEFRDITRT